MRRTGFTRKSYHELIEKKIQNDLKRNFQENAMEKRSAERSRLSIENRIEEIKIEKKVERLKVKSWELCKQIVRLVFMTSTESAFCYSCGKWITEKFGMHTGHFVEKSVCSPRHKHDLLNLRIQCIDCNKYKQQEGITGYTIALTKEFGTPYVDKLRFEMKKTTLELKADIIFWQNDYGEKKKLFDILSDIHDLEKRKAYYYKNVLLKL